MKTISKIIIAGMAVISFGMNASASSHLAATDTTKKSKMKAEKMESKMDSKKMAPEKMDKMSDKKTPSKMKKDTGKMSKM